MPQKIVITKNDKVYDLEFTLQDASGTAIDLTGATLAFKVQKLGAATLAVNAAMVIDTAAAGTCHYQVKTGDFAAAGEYNAEIEITYPGGQISTFGEIYIYVEEELPQT